MFVVVITEIYTFVKKYKLYTKKVNYTVCKLYFNSKKRIGSLKSGSRGTSLVVHVAKTPHSQCREPGFNPWSGS